ncbi:hypothetical protein Moror_3544 [Moniliophthora roreri MCA 2997]|uniref:Uncharacterized protein n=1 Tax=Moniliophthora roreri (strain MCA 2997) TaxID=1381753 RepID=V2W2K6_MONRO|nr:hypothetical protein Moror_3544 [Moniliophthora roreri MCA 2997]
MAAAMLKGLYTGYEKGRRKQEKEGERLWGKETGSIKTITWVEEVGERGRTVMGKGNSFLGSLSLVFIAFAARYHRQNARKSATSPNLLSTKVNTPGLNLWHRNHQESSPGVFWVAEHIYDVAEDSRRRLCINFDINSTLSSSLRFQPQPAPHKYARESVLAYFVLLNSTLASAGSADTFVVTNWTPLPSHHLEPISRPKN